MFRTLISTTTASMILTAFPPTLAHAQSYIALERYARIQNSGSGETLQVDIRDKDVYSPKSVKFSADGLWLSLLQKVRIGRSECLHR